MRPKNKRMAVLATPKSDSGNPHEALRWIRRELEGIRDYNWGDVGSRGDPAAARNAEAMLEELEIVEKGITDSEDVGKGGAK